MAKIFVASDLWFNRLLEDDKNTNIVDRNNKIIKNWNSTVGKNDIVYVLGGFGISDLYNILIQLNGKIHFLDNFYNAEDETFISDLRSGILNSVNQELKMKIVFERKQIITLNEFDVVLSYFPLSDWVGKKSGTYCFHGFNDDIDIVNHNVSCMISKWNDSPVCMDDIMKNIGSFEENIM